MPGTKNKSYIIVVIFIIVIFVLSFGVINPLLSSIENDTVQIISQKEKIFSYQNRIQNFHSYNENYLNFKSNIEKINSFFIDQKEPLGFISFIEKTAEKLNLSVEIFINSNKGESLDLPGLSFQIKTSGAFNNTMKFLSKVESANYLVEINDLNMQKISEKETNNKKQNTGYIQTTMDISVFSKP